MKYLFTLCLLFNLFSSENQATSSAEDVIEQTAQDEHDICIICRDNLEALRAQTRVRPLNYYFECECSQEICSRCIENYRDANSVSIRQINCPQCRAVLDLNAEKDRRFKSDLKLAFELLSLGQINSLSFSGPRTIIGNRQIVEETSERRLLNISASESDSEEN